MRRGVLVVTADAKSDLIVRRDDRRYPPQSAEGDQFGDAKRLVSKAAWYGSIAPVLEVFQSDVFREGIRAAVIDKDRR